MLEGRENDENGGHEGDLGRTWKGEKVEALAHRTDSESGRTWKFRLTDSGE